MNAPTHPSVEPDQDDRQRDLDDTARLILMESPSIGVRDFIAALRVEGFALYYHELVDLRGKYIGYIDVAPTHDVETGERVR